ncbi:hypothetical protein GCM10011609_09020 [Lentzea pudingi]|uniref:Peptidase C14 caspase domain-containing protein n=1 Tax=Lentzea pudingi TaxID=1789439 RepID=A0ABQ2HCD8_9PSEU|nr:caspase family protein [Lentzea pudingi]GGM75278.1 hypothetical protein GCM10011609_09020 [Lentzea pudingi]
MRLADPARSQVVLIGAAHFDDSNLNDLPSVRNNVQDLHRILTDPARGGLTAASCHVFADPRSPDVVRIADIAEQAEDVLLVYYAGHGLISENGRLLFALSDTSERHREINSLHLDQLRAIFRASPAAVQVLVLDCCYSGRITDPGFMSGPGELAEIEGTYTLASSARDEVSLAPRGARHTAFSGELISLLHNGMAGGEELISLRTVYQQLQIALRKKNFPAPRQLHSETAASLALARNVAFGARVQATPSGPKEVAPLVHDLLTVPELAQDVRGLGRQVRDRQLDLNPRMDAVDALVELGADAAGELAELVRDPALPILMRLRLVHELGTLPDHRETAAAALNAITGHSYGLKNLVELVEYVDSLKDVQRFRRRMIKSWDVPAEVDDHSLWGIVMAGLMAAARLGFEQRLAAALELRGLGRPDHADAVLRGMLTEKSIGLLKEVQVTNLLDAR